MDAYVTGVEDWDQKSPGLSFLNLVNRTSTAAMPLLPSSSDYSKSLTFSRYKLMNYRCALEPPQEQPEPGDYNLSAFLESGEPSEVTAQSMTGEENVAHWLKKEIIDKFPDRHHRNRIKVLSERELQLPGPTAPALKTLMKRPDVGVYYNYSGQSYLILQIEVDSGGYEKTCVKLADGIAQQLVWERNRDDTITSCTALYFPTFERGTGVAKLTLVWDDNLFCFHVERTMVPLNELKETTRQLLNDGITKITPLAVCQGTRHVIPMSKSFVTNHFGQGARQVESGESVVIVNVTEKKVHKRPLLHIITSTLLRLCYKGTVFKRSLLPMPPVVDDRYFQFTLLKPPIKQETARSNIASLVSSVVFALNELHEHGLAHLDIRLENVCFDTENRAILIDLDRSQKVDEIVHTVVAKSLMYPIRNDWVYRQWDYVQLGLMIARIICPVSSAEYHTVEPPLNHGFLEKLYREGVMDEELFESWQQDQIDSATRHELPNV